MILNIDRGHIQVKLGEKIATIPGEMFSPASGKTSFVVYLDQIDYWDPKATKQPISSAEITAIVEDIQAEFEKGGHTVEFESA